MWIKKFKNDIRDYIVQEKTVEVPDIEIPSIYESQTEYQLSKKYEVTLCHEVDELTGQQWWFWFEESKQDRISPRFANKQIAEYWMKSLEENAHVK